MKKKILLGVGAIILIASGFIAYTLLTTKNHSPSETVEYSVGDLDMKVVYCKPFKKDRVIFGDEATGALLPNGKYWRLGANEATEITFSKNVSFAGESIQAGSYRMYAVPGASTWQVSLNSELGQWGAFEPNYELDVAKVEVPVESTPNETEQLTIQFESDSTAAMINIMWDKTKVTVPVTAQ